MRIKCRKCKSEFTIEHNSRRRHCFVCNKVGVKRYTAPNPKLVTFEDVKRIMLAAQREIKKCYGCGEEFVTKIDSPRHNKTGHTKCREKWLHSREYKDIRNVWMSKPENRAKAKVYIKKYRQRPEVKAKHNAYQRKWISADRVKAHRKAYSEEYRARPEVKTKRLVMCEENKK